MADSAASGNRVPSPVVRAMFDRIAPIYDAMNTVMTLGLDARWRRAAARATGLRPGMSAVDVACGSGALTRELARRVGPRGEVLGLDLAPAMLRRARARRPEVGAAPPRYARADAHRLPVADASVDAATIAFGLRNVADYGRAMAEMTRITRPGGRVVVLELAIPGPGVGRALAGVWFRRIVPALGRLAGAGAAYAYLPESVDRYPPPEEVARLMTAAGLGPVRWRRLGFGMVTLHAGRRR